VVLPDHALEIRPRPHPGRVACRASGGPRRAIRRTVVSGHRGILAVV